MLALLQQTGVVTQESHRISQNVQRGLMGHFNMRIFVQLGIE